MTVRFFKDQMNRLMGLRFAPADLTTHWEALSDLPEAVLEAAVSLAQRTRVEFPTPVELRGDADKVAHHANPAAPAEDRTEVIAAPYTITVPQAGTVISVAREWRYYCEACSDSGWTSVWCGAPSEKPSARPWQTVQACERHGAHGAHEWVTRCACADTNPALVRKRAAQQKYAETAGKK